jgi:hypothetical protein
VGVGIMVSIRTYEGWWDVSLSNPRNERALLSAAVAAIVVGRRPLCSRSFELAAQS